ncbi:MAG: hypothetical protein EOP85_02330 [Verrucomicrobiaceae bacterium]|nr:MAG: hypothetical protein EOP85_02330 [Verrucomicrobiaceae bacterium]
MHTPTAPYTSHGKGFSGKSALFGTFGMICVTSLAHAALVTQTNLNPNTSTFWNNASVWNNTTVEAGNDYQSVAGATDLGTSFTLDGVAWNYGSNVRDTSGSTPVSSQFAGDRLIMEANTRLLLKGKAGITSTANVVLRNDSHIFHAPDSGGTNRTATLAGSITVNNGALVAMGVRGNGGDTLTVTSTISGGVGSTMVLVLGSGTAGNVNHMRINGDYSAYAGTFYLGTPTTGSLGVTGEGSTFSFAAGSAPFATLQLEPNANYKFDLNSSISFGSVAIGADPALPAGSYDWDELDSLGYGASFLNNGGTLTVIPEASSSLLGLLASSLLLRRRR